MQHLPHMKVPMGGGGSGGAALMANDTYIYQGDAIADGLTPLAGQPWTDASAELLDGLVGDESTGITVTGTKLSILVVHDQGIANEWALTAEYTNGLDQSDYGWNGSAWAALVDATEPSWSDHVGNTFENYTATYTVNALSSRATMVVLTFDNTGELVTDSRLDVA